jgi:hypothetical protein
MARRVATYAAVWERAHRWRLELNDVRISTHATASAACAAARRREGRRRSRTTIVRNVVIGLLVVLIWALALPRSEVANPRYARHETMTDGMNVAYQAIESGSAAVADYTAPTNGFAGGRVDVTLEFGQLGDATGPEQTESGDRTYLALVGQVEDRCYLMRWEPGNRPMLALLTGSVECAPSRAVASHSAIADVAVSRLDTPFDWGPVLPSPKMAAGWFVPLITLLFLVFLMASVDTTIVLIRGAKLEKSFEVTVLGPSDVEGAEPDHSIPASSARHR